MLVSISTPSFDPDGSRTFRITQESARKVHEGARRVSFQATLDGGVLIYDTGYALADREFTLVTQYPSEDLAAWFSRVVRYYPRVHVSIPDGFYEAVPMRFLMDNHRPAIEIRLVEQI